MRSLIRGTLIISAAVALLLVLATGPAGAQGFEEKTVEEAGESTATCDFDGDGVYTDYQVTPGQLVLQNVNSTADGKGNTHITMVNKWEDLEYTYPGASPEAFYNTATIVARFVLDADGNLVHLTIRAHGSGTDAGGNVLFSGPSVTDIDWVDGEPQVTWRAGEDGPCKPGL